MSNHFKSTLTEAADFIKATIYQMCDEKKAGEPIMLHSSPGVGKSAVVLQVGADVKERMEKAFNAKFKMWDIRVGAQQESDIQGIPYPVTVDVVDGIELKDMMFSTPQWFPREGECGILFADELANAPIPNQHACYRLFHDRSIHNGSTLPEGVIVIAAGNTKEDKTGAKGIVPALARRIQAHFFIEPSPEDFITYAMRKRLNPSVAGFVGFMPSDITGTALSGEYGFPCPANYESVSKIMNNRYMPDALKEKGIISCLGSKTGSDFIGFMRNDKWLPDYVKVAESGKYEIPDGVEVDRGITYFIISSTAMKLMEWMSDDSKVKPEEIDNLGAILEKYDVSTAGIAFRSMKRADKSTVTRIMIGKEYPKLQGILKQVLSRTEEMAKGN